MNPMNAPLSGFQDFLGKRMSQRNTLIALAQSCFEQFGFQSQDTPCIERAELLLGKYGEGEKLLYDFQDKGGRHVSLRYDLTVALGRVIQAYSGELFFPYRRYQVGKVWRADKPGKGRFREFIQMDADIVGDDSLLSDVEVMLLTRNVMQAFGARVMIRVNCRPVLDALVEVCGLSPEEGLGLMRTVDKYDKIGKDKVQDELQRNGFSETVVSLAGRYLSLGGSNESILAGLKDLLSSATTFNDGFARLSALNDVVRSTGQSDWLRIDPTIARGLDYYTGVIFETTLLDNPDFGSVCSGGRYDRLIKHPDGRLLPSIGLSVGIDRLFSALESLNILPVVPATTQVLIVNFDDTLVSQYLQIATELRSVGISVEIFNQPQKVAKQLKVANGRGIPLVILMGSDEIEKSQVGLKDMRLGEETKLDRDAFVAFVQKKLNGA